jgi:glycosyltransferase involved in cell wall biosynthesis
MQHLPQLSPIEGTQATHAFSNSLNVSGMKSIDKEYIVIVNDFGYINGGTAKVAISSAIGLRRKGYKVIYFCAVEPVNQELRQGGVQVVCTGQHEILKNSSRMSAATQGVWNFRAARILGKILEDLPPKSTIVHLHGWTKALSSSLMPVIFRHQVLPIITLHDYFISCPNGGFYNYNTQESCVLKPLSRQCLLTNCDSRNMGHKVWRVARQIIQERIGRIPEGIKNFIVLSDFSYRLLNPYLPQGTRVFHVPNPIDIAQEPAAEVAANDEFLMVGRLTLEKGCMLLAEASKQKDCKTVFVGDGEVREQISRLNPEAHLTGWQSHPEVQRWLSKSRALVFPSLCHETQGLTILEAAAKGVPAIVSDGCAGRNLIVHGETGLLFHNGDVVDLAEKIMMLKDPKLAEHLGRQAYEKYWASPYTIDKHTSTLVNIYWEVLSNYGTSKDKY